jgi:hypothetical protein
MLKHVIILGILLIIVSAIFYFPNKEIKANANILFNSNSSIVSPVVINTNANFDTTKTPIDITIPSSIGKVVFPHEMHIKDMEIECVRCHHQIKATELRIPHPEYFRSSWINCNMCHKDSDSKKKKIYSCSECHRAYPRNIADETLSSKVVVHQKCWECHEVGTGKGASENCKTCHSREK